MANEKTTTQTCCPLFLSSNTKQSVVKVFVAYKCQIIHKVMSISDGIDDPYLIDLTNLLQISLFVWLFRQTIVRQIRIWSGLPIANNYEPVQIVLFTNNKPLGLISILWLFKCRGSQVFDQSPRHDWGESNLSGLV